MPTFQLVVDVSLLSPKSLWVLLLLTTSFVFGRFPCHQICTPLKVDFFFHYPRLLHLFTILLYFKAQLDMYLFDELFQEKNIRFTQHAVLSKFYISENMLKGLCKISMCLKQTTRSSWAGKALHILLSIFLMLLKHSKEALKYLLIWITDTFPTKPYQKERV